MGYVSDMLRVTEDTAAMIKAATSGIDTTTAIAGIDFLPDLLSWFPVDTPFFNSVPRGQGKGAVAVIYESILNNLAAQNYRGVPKNQAAQIAQVQAQYTFSPYGVVGQGGRVTWDAIAQGEDYTDVLAVDTLFTINNTLIALEINQLNAAPFALPAISAPTLAASSTGGSIGAVTVYVKAAAKSGMNWYSGDGQGNMGSALPGPAANTSALTGSTNSVTASVPAVKGAAGYDWLVSTNGTTYYYYTTTPVNTVTITSVPSANQTVPTGYAGLFGSYGAGSPITGIVVTTDSSYDPTWIQGLTASILGDWSSTPQGPVPGSEGSSISLVTPGTGVSQGAYYQSLDGAPLTVSGASIEEIDRMDKTIYDTYQVSLSRLLVGSQVITDISNAFLDTPQAVMWLSPDARDGRLEGVMGGHVASYVNKTVGGHVIPLWLMPYLPPGQIVGVIDSLPFPGSNVTSALSVRTLYDFFRFDYGANRVLDTADAGPRYDFEVRSQLAFINKAAPICGVLANVGAGA